MHERDCRLAGFSLADEDEVRRPSDEAANGATEGRVIIDRDDAAGTWCRGIAVSDPEPLGDNRPEERSSIVRESALVDTRVVPRC
jgi:hypothetical protein